MRGCSVPGDITSPSWAGGYGQPNTKVRASSARPPGQSAIMPIAITAGPPWSAISTPTIRVPSRWPNGCDAGWTQMPSFPTCPIGRARWFTATPDRQRWWHDLSRQRSRDRDRRPDPAWLQARGFRAVRDLLRLGAVTLCRWPSGAALGLAGLHGRHWPLGVSRIRNVGTGTPRHGPGRGARRHPDERRLGRARTGLAYL